MTEKKTHYSPVEVCKMFEISKSTLLRWEREGMISPARRDNSDQRLYTEVNLREIGQQLRPQIATRFKRMILSDDEDESAKAHEDLYIWKFMQGDVIALAELENFPEISAESIRKLHRIGLERYEPSSPMFVRVAKIVADKAEKLYQKNKK